MRGLPPRWPHKNEKPKVLSEEEKSQVLSAIARLPKRLIKENVKIYRMEKSKDFPNPATHASGVIVLYDTALRSTRLERILAHEFAHEHYDQMTSNQKDNYRAATNWFEHKSIIINRGEGFVKEDGRLSVEEDFSNNVEFFLFEPARLKAVTPKAHQWLSEQFNGKFKLGAPCDFTKIK